MNNVLGTRTPYSYVEPMAVTHSTKLENENWGLRVPPLHGCDTQLHRHTHVPYSTFPVALGPQGLGYFPAGVMYEPSNLNLSLSVTHPQPIYGYRYNVHDLQPQHMHNQCQNVVHSSPVVSVVPKESGVGGIGLGRQLPTRDRGFPQMEDSKPSASSEPCRQKKENGGGTRDSLSVVHVDSFTYLERLHSTNTLVEFLLSCAPKQANSRADASSVRFLILVGKQYLGGSVSNPSSQEDIIVSEEVAKEFLDVRYVHCDDGHLLVDLPSGACVSKRIHSTFRKALVQLSTFEVKTFSSDDPKSLHALTSKTLPRIILSDASIYATLLHLFTCGEGGECSDNAVDVWSRLIREPTPNSSLSEATEGTPAHYDQEEHTETQPVGGTASLLPSCGVALFSAVQGFRLFRQAMSCPRLRKHFFQMLAEATTPQTQGASQDDEASDEATRAVTKRPSEQCFMAIFSCSLASYFIFDCFGLVNGAQCCDELDVICTCLKRLAVKVACSNGGSFTLIGLVRALYSRLAGGHAGELWEKSSGTTHENSLSPIGETSDNGRRGCLSAPEMTRVHTRSYEKFFHAVVRGLVSGEGPGSTREEKVSRSRRVKFLTQHVIACRVTQSLIPVLVYSIRRMEDRVNVQEHGHPMDDEEMAADKQYIEDCLSFLEEATDQCGLMVNHAHGNYVLQALIRELVRNSKPESSIGKMLQKVSDMLVASILEVSQEKFASNCLEALIDACKTTESGNAMILRLGSTLIKRGKERMLQVTFDQYGNYVVRKMLTYITSIAAGEIRATDSERREADMLKEQYLSVLILHAEQLRAARYGSGIYDWVSCQRCTIPTQRK